MTQLVEGKIAGRHAPSPDGRDLGWYVRLGFFGSACFLGTTITWATVAPLEGAVMATGTVAVENNISRIQHPTGGVVGVILVKEGQRVEAEQVLIKLDETATRANLQIVVNEMTSTRARLARLRAEQEGAGAVGIPQELIDRAVRDAEVRQTINSELALFAAREKSRRGQRGQYEQQIKQLRQEIEGTVAQQVSAQRQLEVAELELRDMRGLLTKNLVARPRVTQLEREVARIRGLLGELTAKSAQINSKIAETELLILQIDRTLESEVAKEIRENETRLNELREKLATAEDQLRRVELKAPREGIVHQLQVHTVGGVIAPGAVVMNIVPERDTLVIDARVTPIDIDQIYPDQPARVRFSAFNTRTTPELNGRVFRIAADLSRDEKTGVTYYLVGLKIDEEEMKKLGKLRLIPGMPAEGFIKTTERTIASFLVRPLRDHMNRAFREE
jgi:HlyD family secretion protein